MAFFGDSRAHANFRAHAIFRAHKHEWGHDRWPVRSHNSSDKPSASSARRLEERAIASLRAALERAGWESDHPSGGPRRRPDIIFRRGPRVIAVELKAAPGRARRAILRGQLADAVLQSKAWAQESNAEPLAVVAAPAISDEIASELASYIDQVAPGMAWGLLDERGRFELHGEGLEGARPPEQQALFYSQRPQPPPVHNPFSDLGQWMLKVLLAGRVPENWLSAPRHRIRGVADLAEAAQVSPASASRFLAALDAEGYLAQSPEEFRLIRVRALLHAWRRSMQRPMERRYARFLLPSNDPYRHLQSMLVDRVHQRELFEGASSVSISARLGPKGKRACLGLFAACRSLGVGFVKGAPIHLICEDASPGVLKELELIPVNHRAESELIVVRPRFPEAVFRGCVLVEEAPVSDILQCWLDVSFHAARGEEQAAEIAARLGLEEWSE